MGSDKRDKKKSRSRDRSDRKQNKKRDDNSLSKSKDRDRQQKNDYKSRDNRNRDRSRSGERRRQKDDRDNNRYDRNRDNDRKDYKRDDRKDKYQGEQKTFGKNKNEIVIEISQEERQGGKENVRDRLDESDLINALKEDVGFLTIEYNRKQQEEREKAIQEAKDAKEKRTLELFAPATGRAGGVYVPPYKLRLLQEEMMQKNDNQSEEHQKLMWDLLRKSINGIVNKVNISNIQNVIVELLNENLLRGKGLFARAIIKAQLSSPNFTHVYAALISVINTKMPDIVDLIIRRVILQFQRSYKRNNKLVCEAAIKMIAHLINQRVLSDFVGLQLMFLLLEDPNEDKVDLACQFMIEGGQILSETTPEGVNAIFERLKGILHEGECERRIQYSIEHLFAVRKTKYKDHPGVIPELDLVEEEDIIEHNYDLLDPIDPEDHENIFKLDPHFEKTEKEWESIKLEILGEENILSLKQIKTGLDEEENDEENPDQMVIKDLTDEDRVNLRRTLYLVIMSSVDFEECAHKILKMSLGVGHEEEICQMILECCQNERTYLKFYGLLAQRFCEMTELYKDKFMKCFVELYSTIHRFETAKIRNSSKFYGHLFYTDSIDWRIFACITLTQETTTASSRIFIKNLILEICENTGLENLQQRFNKEEHLEFFNGLFPIDHPRNTRFAINFFISIGLGALTERLSEHLKKQTEEMQRLQMQQQIEALQNEVEQESSSSSSSSSDSDNSSDSDSDSSSDEDSSEEESSDSDNDKKKKKNKKSDDKKEFQKKSKSKKK